LILVRIWDFQRLLHQLSLFNGFDEASKARLATDSAVRNSIGREVDRISSRVVRLSTELGGATVDPWLIAFRQGQGLVPLLYSQFVSGGAKIASDLIHKVYRAEIDLPQSKRTQSIEITVVDDRGVPIRGTQILCPRVAGTGQRN